MRCSEMIRLIGPAGIYLTSVCSRNLRRSYGSRFRTEGLLLDANWDERFPILYAAMISEPFRQVYIQWRDMVRNDRGPQSQEVAS